MIKHTEEKWSHVGSGVIWNCNQPIQTIASCGGFISSEDVREANAERIVACVNSCEGISNKALKAGVIGEMVDFIKDGFGDVDVMNKTDIELTAWFGDWRDRGVKLLAKLEASDNG